MPELDVETLRDALKAAFPGLDWANQYGAAAEAVARLSVRRDDLQFVVYQGQLRVGYADERQEDLVGRAGTRYVEPSPDDWYAALSLASSLPRKAQTNA